MEFADNEAIARSWLVQDDERWGQIDSRGGAALRYEDLPVWQEQELVHVRAPANRVQGLLRQRPTAFPTPAIWPAPLLDQWIRDFLRPVRDYHVVLTPTWQLQIQFTDFDMLGLGSAPGVDHDQIGDGMASSRMATRYHGTLLLSARNLLVEREARPSIAARRGSFKQNLGRLLWAVDNIQLPFFWAPASEVRLESAPDQPTGWFVQCAVWVVHPCYAAGGGLCSDVCARVVGATLRFSEGKSLGRNCFLVPRFTQDSWLGPPA